MVPWSLKVRVRFDAQETGVTSPGRIKIHGPEARQELILLAVESQLQGILVHCILLYKHQPPPYLGRDEESSSNEPTSREDAGDSMR